MQPVPQGPLITDLQVMQWVGTPSFRYKLVGSNIPNHHRNTKYKRPNSVAIIVCQVFRDALNAADPKYGNVM